jgi:hypothetical protein
MLKVLLTPETLPCMLLDDCCGYALSTTLGYMQAVILLHVYCCAAHTLFAMQTAVVHSCSADTVSSVLW